MTAHDYWMALSDQLGEQKCLPIWQWSAFEDSQSARNQLNAIREILENHFTRKEFGPNVAVLFLIHCALKMRLDLQWSNSIKSYREDIFNNVDWGNQQQWISLIKSAENVLQRKPLETKNRYEARIKIESGIPLSAIKQGTEQTTWRHLKRIWNRIDLPDTVLERWIEDEYEANQNSNHQNVLPGGEGAGFHFLKYGITILRDVDENNISRSLEQRHHFYPSTQGFVQFLEGSNRERDLDNELNWRKIVQINRILRLTGSPILYTHFILREDPSKQICDVILKCPSKESKTIAYDNGNFAPGTKPSGFFDSIEPVEIEINYQRDGAYQKINQQILDKLTADIIFFKPFYRNGELRENYYTHLERQPKAIEFPIVAALSDDYQNSYCLNTRDFFVGNINIKGLGNYNLYKFENLRDYNSSGLSNCPTELKLESPRQHFDVFQNGRKIKKISSGWPISPIFSSSVLRQSNGRWENVHFYNEVKNIHLSNFKLNTDNSEKGTEIAVFPKNFLYKFEFSRNSVIGLKLYSGANTEICPKEIRIDRIIANETLWSSLKHESIIECDIITDNDKILTLRIPSPIEGLSWRFESGNLPDTDDGCKKIPLRESKKTFLHYEATQGNSVILPDRIHWVISLMDYGQRLLLRDEIQYISNKYKDKSLFLELPNYLDILFSSTNSTEAKIKIEAHLLLDGEPANYRASNESRRISLIISRFDERTPPAETSYFYFGLLNPQDKCTQLNETPSQDELSKDFWVKVPAIELPGNHLVWNGIHRIRSYENNIFRADGLQGIQSILANKNYSEVISGLQEYFNTNKLLSETDKTFIDKYMCFCFIHKIPLCNLWLLQVVLECDWIACQIPSITELINKNESSYKFAFDGRLLRPEILGHEQYSAAFYDDTEDEIDESTINAFNLNSNLEKWRSVTGTFENLGKKYEKFFQEEVKWENVKEWKKTVCYIVENVILTPNNNDQRHQQHYLQALRCLRLLETVDDKSVALLLQKLVLNKYEKNIKGGFEYSARAVSKELGVKIDEEIGSYDGKYGFSVEQATHNGRIFALNKCWEKIVDKCCERYNSSPSQYGSRPNSCEKLEDFKNIIKPIIQQFQANKKNTGLIPTQKIDKLIINLEREIEEEAIQELESHPGVKQWLKDYSIIAPDNSPDITEIKNSFISSNCQNYEYTNDVKRVCHALALKALLQNRLEKIDQKYHLDTITFKNDLDIIIDKDDELPYQEELIKGFDYLSEWIKLNRPEISEYFKQREPWWRYHCMAFPDDVKLGFPKKLLERD